MLERHLAQAERHVTEGEQHILRQRNVIAEREHGGYGGVDDARQVLVEFEITQTLHIAQRDRIRQALEEGALVAISDPGRID
jgi:hypothetical protein